MTIPDINALVEAAERVIEARKDADHAGELMRERRDFRFLANPSTILSLAARIKELEGELKASQSQPSDRRADARSVGLDAELSTAERHELECLRHQVGQLEYPCSPYCEGYLRELAMRNGGSRP
jgi:hypothetical protein